MSAKTLVCTQPCEGCQSNHAMLNENIASASLEVAARSLHEASEEWRPWWWWRWPLARLWGHAKKAAGGLRANGQSPFLYAPIASCYQPQGSLTHLGFLSSLCILCCVLTDTHTFVAENESNKISNLCVDADGIRSSSSGREGGMDVFILKKQGRQLLSGLTPLSHHHQQSSSRRIWTQSWNFSYPSFHIRLVWQTVTVSWEMGEDIDRSAFEKHSTAGKDPTWIPKRRSVLFLNDNDDDAQASDW